MLQCLKDSFVLVADDAQALNNWALRYAARSNKVAVLQFLKEVFHLTADDAQVADNCALLGAAENGDVAVLQCLRDVFQLATDDAWADNNYVLRWAARSILPPTYSPKFIMLALTLLQHIGHSFVYFFTCERPFYDFLT
jgi:hypothetical protein